VIEVRPTEIIDKVFSKIEMTRKNSGVIYMFTSPKCAGCKTIKEMIARNKPKELEKVRLVEIDVTKELREHEKKLYEKASRKVVRTYNVNPVIKAVVEKSPIEAKLTPVITTENAKKVGVSYNDLIRIAREIG